MFYANRYITRNDLFNTPYENDVITNYDDIKYDKDLLNGNEYIDLYCSNKFSDRFIQYIGQNNITDIHCLDDPAIRREMFEAIVEHEAMLLYKNGKSFPSKLLQIDEGSYNLCCGYDNLINNPITVKGTVDDGGNLICNINNRGDFHTSWVELFGKIYNMSHDAALYQLSKCIGLSYESMYRFISDIQGNPCVNPCHVQPSLYLTRHSGIRKSAELIKDHSYFIFSALGYILGAMACYQLGDRLFCVQVTAGSEGAYIGKYLPKAYFLNQNIMNEHPSAPVILIQDTRVALYVQNLLDKVSGYNPAEDGIVTTHLGIDLAVLPWDVLYSHPVTLVPAPTKRDMAMAKGYKNKLKGIAAINFMISKKFILPMETGCDLTGEIDGISEGEAEVIRNSINLATVDQPVALLKQVQQEQRAYDEYKAFWQTKKVFKSEEKSLPKSLSTETVGLGTLDTSLLPKSPSSLSDVSLYHILRPGTMGMLLGAKGSGKTQVALSACNAILSGDYMWPFFRGCANHENIVYVDAETPFDEYQANLQQHGLAGKVGIHFFGLSAFAPKLPDFCERFSLNDQEFRDGLTAYLLKHKCRFLVLDNLTALMGDAVQQTSSATRVLDWVKKLQQQQICILLVHHKNQTDSTNPGQEKARGSQNFETLARSVIVLLSKADILASSAKISENVSKAAVLDGLTVGLYYRVSKAAPILDGKTFWLRLPLGCGTWEYLSATDASGSEISRCLLAGEDSKKEVAPSQCGVIEGDFLPTEDEPIINQVNEPLKEKLSDKAVQGNDLSPDEHNVLDALMKRPKTRAEIQQVTGLSKSTVLNRLADLKKKKLVIQKGKGRGAHYHRS